MAGPRPFLCFLCSLLCLLCSVPDSVGQAMGPAFAAAYANLRGSATRPSTALAAAVNGDASNVRAPWPCRPSKFRLLVLTDVWPAGTESPFMAMQMLHP